MKVASFVEFKVRETLFFSLSDILEYLSDVDEKWKVREVNICSVGGVLRQNDGLVVKGIIKSVTALGGHVNNNKKGINGRSSGSDLADKLRRKGNVDER